jgi:hypothetical protein
MRRSRRGSSGGRSGAGRPLALTILLFVLAVGRYADVTAPALYGRLP